MAINREISQFANFVQVDEVTQNIGIATDLSLNNFVGIGTSHPSAKLDVVGQTELDNLNVSVAATIGFGSISAAYIGFSTIGFATIRETYINDARISGILTTRSIDITGTGTLGDVSASSLVVSPGISTLDSLIVNNTAKISNIIYPLLDGQKGQVVVTDGAGNLGFGTAAAFFANRIYVSSVSGDDANDGSILAVKTIKKASQLASLKSGPTAIFVETGEYVEDNPIILYDDVSIIGDNLRNTVIRPLNAGKDMFRVRNGSYVTGFTLKDYVSSNTPVYTFDYAVAFDDPDDATTSRVGYAVTAESSLITRSPYIQNCSIISFLGANGVLVDGSKVKDPNIPVVPEEAERPVAGDQPVQGKSMVANAFTMVSFGGIGWRCINEGYAQVVSCFQIFCEDGSLCESGGYLSITNSATNFGNNALRAEGFNLRSYSFDRGIIAEHGVEDVKQTMRVVGLGRSDQELYVARLYTQDGKDVTNDFKPTGIGITFDGLVGIATTNSTITSNSHGLANGDTLAYIPDPSDSVLGLSTVTQYYVKIIDLNTLQLFVDNSFTVGVALTSTSVGIHTLNLKNPEFFASEIKPYSHNDYQKLTLVGLGSFIPGRTVQQPLGGGATAYGYVIDYNSSSNELIVSNELLSGNIKYGFNVTGGTFGSIQDHHSPATTIGITSIAGISTYYTVDFVVDATESGQLIQNIGILTTNYRLRFHRPSIVNSSAHTWEYSGSGTDYNALPENGGSPNRAKEQIFRKGGRVYSSGTNELGDFKIGNFIVAKNRTGNISFTNTVSIGNLSVLTLGVGGVSVDSISNDIGLGDNDAGGPSDRRLTTQLAQRTFLNNRLGNFIDKTASTSGVPNAVVLLNSAGKINSELLPPSTVSNFYYVGVGAATTTRTELANDIPARDLKTGDIVVENNGITTTSYQLFTDAESQYLILSDSTRDYNFITGDVVISSIESSSGIVTVPTNVGYGTTGLVKGVGLDISILNEGSGYTPGEYVNVSLASSTGTGSSMRANVTIDSSGEVSNVDVVFGGKDYAVNDVLQITSGIPQAGINYAAFTIDSVETRLYVKIATNNIKFTASNDSPNYIKDRDAVGLTTSVTSSYIIGFTPASAIDTITNRITIGSNNLIDGDIVQYSDGGNTTIGGLVDNGLYYIKKVTSTAIELHHNYGLTSPVDILTLSTGTHTITRKTVAFEKDTIVLLNHNYSTGDAVTISGSDIPAGISSSLFYYVGSATTNNFTLHPLRSNAIISVGGTTIQQIDITSSGSGNITFTKQNVEIVDVINTSSTNENNYVIISGNNIDASNIISGTVSPTRLGSGSASEDTFLSGNSSYQKVVKGVGIGTTEPINITSSAGYETGGGFTTYFGKVNISIRRADESTFPSDDYGNLGVARFKKSQFKIANNGAVRLKNSTTDGGDIDALTLEGRSSGFYRDPSNLTSAVPVEYGGTALNVPPPVGQILVGNGVGYNLTENPTITGSVTSPTFIGTFIGNLTGTATTLADGANITTGTINNARLPQQIDLTSSGIATIGRVHVDTITGPSTIVIDPSAIGDNTGIVRIKGDLVVDGNTVTVNANNLDISDKVIGIASTSIPTDAVSADQAGISVYGTTLKTLLYNNAQPAWKSNQDFDLSSGKVYRIDAIPVLSSTTLGSGVINSSLTSLGTLTNLNVLNTGIGTIPIADITTRLNTTQITEKANIVGSGAGGNYNLGSSGVVYFHTVANGSNWTPNFRYDGVTNLGDILTTGQSVTVTVIATQSGAATYSSSVQIDGNSSFTYGIQWSGASAPTFGSSSGLDIYTYTLIRSGTGTNDWLVLASRTQYD